jgi:hypothetical protein
MRLFKMTSPIFQQSYMKLQAKFGVNYFGKNKAAQVFQILKPVPDDIGEKLIDEILTSDLFTINKPPGKEAFLNIVEKAATEKKRAEFREQKAKENLHPDWAAIKASGQGDGLSKALKQFGVSSVDELIQNNWKPRKV